MQRNVRLPPWAAWEHTDGSAALEVVFIRSVSDGIEFEGVTSAAVNGERWRVDYRLTVGHDWATRSAQITSRYGATHRKLQLEAAESGHWRVDGSAVSDMSGCLDVDLEISALTNALPIQRLGLRPGAAAQAPAVYVRAPDLRLERLDQSYLRLPDGERLDFEYEAPRFDFKATLRYDRDGLVRDYPGVAQRAL